MIQIKSKNSQIMFLFLFTYDRKMCVLFT
uniref:Uncharacterized protein n=1 Tax=Anguilla anguilla TaxID=7936 RepID=A0A0E9PTF4_ANGAN